MERVLPIGPFIQKETFDSTEASDVQTTHSRTAAFVVPLQKRHGTVNVSESMSRGQSFLLDLVCFSRLPVQWLRLT